MFTGIIEEVGKIVKTEKDGDNIHFTISASFWNELKVDQSVAHNGVCLTVVSIDDGHYIVTAIQETLNKSNLGQLEEGDYVNLERCLRIGDRLDGHIVQGHVDSTATCDTINELDGSWEFIFTYTNNHVTVPKGSITVNGVSLTVVKSKSLLFSVCVIPYTFEHTNFKHLKEGDKVNLEFDVIGKYVARLFEQQNSK